MSPLSTTLRASASQGLGGGLGLRTVPRRPTGGVGCTASGDASGLRPGTYAGGALPGAGNEERRDMMPVLRPASQNVSVIKPPLDVPLRRVECFSLARSRLTGQHTGGSAAHGCHVGVQSE